MVVVDVVAEENERGTCTYSVYLPYVVIVIVVVVIVVML